MKDEDIKVILEDVRSKFDILADGQKELRDRLVKIEEKVDANFEQIGRNRKLIENNTRLIGSNKKLIENNTRLIGSNRKLIENNTRLIENNKVLIGSNKKLIGSNKKLIENIQNDVRFIKSNLVRKVDHKEFKILDNRTVALERKVANLLKK